MKKLFTLVLLVLVTCIHQFCFSQGIDKPRYQIITHRAGNYLGTFNIELFPLIAPLAVQNFDSLVGVQFFDSTAFHRVVPGFVIQGGDPNSINGPVSTWGQGNPNQPNVPAEFSVVRHLRGIIGAARDVDTNSANSQFYICVAPATFLDGQYTVYGQVTSGMEVVDTIVASPRDVNDVPLQKIEMFVSYIGVNDTIPDPPTLTSPANNLQGVLNTQTFLWSTVPGAVMYTVEFSTDPLFTIITNWRNAGLNSTTMPSLLPSTAYYWRVKSNNGGHESIYSNVYAFNTGTAAATLISPADASTNIVTNPVFEWSPVPNATDYTLQVSLSSVFTVGNLVYNQSGLTGVTQQVGGLNPNTLYYWRVRSAANGVQGYYSTKFSFTTGTGVGVNETDAINSDFSLTDVFPNPAYDILKVNTISEKPGKIYFELKNIEGKTVSIFSKKVSAKKTTTNIDVHKLSKGMYVLEVRMNESSIYKQIEIN